jgi:hypothetical protein
MIVISPACSLLPLRHLTCRPSVEAETGLSRGRIWTGEPCRPRSADAGGQGKVLCTNPVKNLAVFRCCQKVQSPWPFWVRISDGGKLGCLLVLKKKSFFLFFFMEKGYFFCVLFSSFEPLLMFPFNLWFKLTRTHRLD